MGDCKGLENAISDNYVHKGFSKRRKQKRGEKNSTIYKRSQYKPN